MKMNNFVMIIIFVSFLFTTTNFSQTQKKIDYNYFVALDSNKELLKLTMGYYEQFSSEKYKNVNIDSNYYYTKIKDSISLGNTINVYSNSELQVTFHSKEVFNAVTYFQSGIELKDNLLLIKYTSVNSSLYDNLIVYNYRLNKVIDTLQNIYYYSLNGDKIFVYFILENRKYVKTYDLLSQKEEIIDSTESLVDFIYILPLDNQYLKFNSNFFENDIVLIDSNFNYLSQIHLRHNERYDFLSFTKDYVYFKVNTKSINDRILKYNRKTSLVEYVFSNIIQNHIQYSENDYFEFLVYDSLLFKKLIARNKKSFENFTFDLGFTNLQYAALDSVNSVCYVNTFSKQYKYQINLITNQFKVDTTILSSKYDDSLVILKNKDHYCAYHYIYSKGSNFKTRKILMKVYGGFATYQLPYLLGEDEEYLLNNGLSIAHTIISGDGNFGWNGFLTGNQENIYNVIEDIKLIAEDIYQKQVCKEKSIIIKGESFGAYIAASTLSLFPHLFDSGILRAGEYSIKEAIEFLPSKIEQFGNYNNKLVTQIHNKISPITNISNGTKQLPELLICNYEYDKNVNNVTVKKLIEALDKNKQKYYFNLLSGADHISSRSYYQALNHFYLENLYLLYRLKQN